MRSYRTHITGCYVEIYIFEVERGYLDTLYQIKTNLQ